jgi:hypothetical protein
MQDPVFAGKGMCGCLSSTKACFVCVLPRSGECVVLEGLMGWVVRDRGLGVRNRSQRVRDAGDIPPLDHDGRTLGGRASVSVVEKVDVRGGIVAVGSCKCMLGTGVVLRRSYWSTKEGSGRSSPVQQSKDLGLERGIRRPILLHSSLRIHEPSQRLTYFLSFLLFLSVSLPLPSLTTRASVRRHCCCLVTIALSRCNTRNSAACTITTVSLYQTNITPFNKQHRLLPSTLLSASTPTLEPASTSAPASPSTSTAISTSRYPALARPTQSCPSF